MPQTDHASKKRNSYRQYDNNNNNRENEIRVSMVNNKKWAGYSKGKSGWGRGDLSPVWRIWKHGSWQHHGTASSCSQQNPSNQNGCQYPVMDRHTKM